MINPHICYAVSWLVALLVYSMGWSILYPSLDVTLIIFIVVTLIVHVILWKRVKVSERHTQKSFSEPKIDSLFVTVFIYVLLIVDFVFGGGIPLFKLILNIPFDYRLFGTPVLHVFVVSFGSFYTVYLFHFYLTSKKKKYLYLFLLNLSIAILICSRAMLIFNLTAAAVLYLNSLQRLPLRLVFYSVPAIVVILFLFGVVGTRRASFELNQSYNTNLFLENGEASPSFRKSSVPSEFFWSYFYISSPLANLQLNIRHFKVPSLSWKRSLEFFNNEILFESISKRLNALLKIHRESEFRVKSHFNASTIYSVSYSYLGWLGMVIMALYLIAFPIFYERMTSLTSCQSVGNAIICCCYLFLAYDNTLRLMGLGFQLIYPLVYPLFENIFVKMIPLSKI